MASSKKGISAHQLHRSLDITYKTAWFLAHRIREAMRAGGLAAPSGQRTASLSKLTKLLSAVLKGDSPRRDDTLASTSNKNTVLTLVERGGAARSCHNDGDRRVAEIAAHHSRESQPRGPADDRRNGHSFKVHRAKNSRAMKP